MNRFATVTSRPVSLPDAHAGVPAAKVSRGFTLTEVVLAVGVLSLAIVALLGLFGPTMSSVKNVIDRGGAITVADQLNALLFSNEIYEKLGISDLPAQGGNEASLSFDQLGQKIYSTGTTGFPVYAWRKRDSGSAIALDKQEMEFTSTKPTGVPDNLEGSVFMLKMEASKAGGYDGDYGKHAYFPINVSIYELPPVGVSADDAKKQTPLFQFTTAKLR